MSARLWAAAAAALLIGAGPALACDPRARLDYLDSAPSDSLTVLNATAADGPTAWRLVRLEIDLRPATGEVMFDAAAGGVGYSMFVAPESADLLEPAALSDDDRKAQMRLAPKEPGARTVIYLDLDDAAGGAGTYVSGAAIAGARAIAFFEAPGGAKADAGGVFDDKGIALLAPPACV